MALAQPSVTNRISAFEVGFGAVWAVFFYSIIGDFRTSCQKLKEVRQLDPKAPGVEERLQEARRRAFVNGASLVGSTAWTLSWLHSLQVISIAFAASYLKALSYGSWIITGSFRACDAAAEFREKRALVERVSTLQAIEEAQTERNLALAKLILNVSSAAWGVLGGLSMIPGIVIPSSLMGASMLIGGGALVYALFLEFDRKKNKAAAPAHA